jgi:putative membrane protein
MGWYDHYYGMSAWGWLATSIGLLLVLGLLVLGGVLLARAVRPPAPPPAARPPSAEQLLAERYAQGEIAEDEYRQRLATLRGTSTAAGPR